MSESNAARPTANEKKDGITRFIDRLEALKQEGDRAALARLRRSLADYGQDFSAYAVLGSALPAKASAWTLESYLLVAGLFAMHQKHSTGGNTLGWSLRLLREALGDVGGKSLDLLVAALLNADREDLPVRLRHIITRLASPKETIAVDYGQLLRDLLRWNTPRRTAQRRWAHDYWVAGTEPGDDAAARKGGDDNLSGEK